MIPIKNVFNEFYPADCSHKVKQAFVSKAKNGEFIGSQAAYGLKKCESDKHMLEFDEETAPIVRWMFEMAAYHGYGYNKIARALTQQKVITPAAYQAQKAGREYNKDPYEWNLVTVYRMMENQTYLGHLVSGKRRKLSYKSKKIVRQDESEWIVVKNQFPALISEQLWEDAHKALGSRKRESKSGTENIFAGLIKCEKCGYALGICNASDRDNYADSAYVGKKLPQHIQNEVCEKGYRNMPLTAEQKENNRRKSKIRSRIEHVFGFMTMSMHGLTVRSIGFQRAAFNIGLTNPVYNLCPFAYLCRKEFATG